MFYAFEGSIGLALVGLVLFVLGMLRVRRDQVRVKHPKDELSPRHGLHQTLFKPNFTKLAARTTGVTAEYADSMMASEIVPGLKARDPKAIGFALRSGGLALFGVSTFLAIDTGMVAYGEGAGWGFLVFVAFFVGTALTRLSPRR